jgi:hypothetical protein
MFEGKYMILPGANNKIHKKFYFYISWFIVIKI